MHHSLLLWYLVALLLPAAIVSGWQITGAGRGGGAAHACRQGTSLLQASKLDAAAAAPTAQLSTVSRRFVLLKAPLVAVGVTAGAMTSVPRPALAISADAAKEQWKQSVGVIDAMMSDWSSMEKKGGDSIRVALGTQGTTSPLFQIEKALKVLRDEAEDLVEFTEQSDDFMLRLAAADSMAYSANFAGGSGKPTPPAVYIEKSRKEVEDMQRIAKALSALL
mmetsp:Transcript_22776/g.65664  ORF Transcript_22776/g.65664 Transcript_22776/m.65664 type:complete len:221 (-) Transcript_22776:223-885(-)|eukprot:CAMPEP_0181040814 /NCGR_PEP_ID=MMETSP1070-20121207/11258_1 /TAXON_ID=265543 /ORGANISM="Minutocellus polymorphus, Strain NH13" /LENGTH=220 /DNA_ID=CAMNT_0023118867 /DNA_START=54 /DNA_END=716 /DNA_ORIENTATION=+